jgi:hypothetical protein
MPLPIDSPLTASIQIHDVFGKEFHSPAPLLTNLSHRHIIQVKLREILYERISEMLHVTELARKTGASVDEVHYLEKKGFIQSTKSRLTQREVRQFQDADVRKIQLIIKYRRQGFTWDTAFQKAREELDKPTLFDRG